jgi:hypothetical protein
LGYITVILTFPQVFSPAIKKLGVFMPALYGILVSANFIGCVGIWYYKQWGVELYLLSFFSKTLLFLLIGQFSFGFYLGIVLSLASIFILLRFYPKMSPNL